MSSGAAPRVLLIGDDKREHPLQAALAGAAAIVAVDVAAALAESEARAWDVVLIDLAAAEAAVDLVRQLRATQPDLPTIVLSPDQSAATIQAGLDEGAFLWLVSPVPVEVVHAALLRARERRSVSVPSMPSGPVAGLTSPMAHTINNQLGGIIGLAQLHLADEALSDDLRDDLEMILQGARTIADLLKQVRAQSATPDTPTL